MNQLENIQSWTKPPFSKEIQEEAKQALLQFQNGQRNDVTDSFSETLEFGTGGIRGVLGNGSGRMNVFTVGRAAFGFGKVLKQKNKKAIVVIAHDSRRQSVEFATTTAGILANLGIQVKLFKGVAPTPLLSFAVRYYKADGGVVITASHNPPEYNGFKAYLSDGGQLVSPMDKKIISEIESLTDWSKIPFLSPKDKTYKKFVGSVSKDCFKDYLKKIEKSAILSENVSKKTRKDLSIVYSPLHGTGGYYMQKTLNSFGYKNVFLVPEQKEPDGEFPTVKYPNPEEREALELCIQHSKKRKADIFIATDPDADRLGVGVRDQQGEYTLLNGNQIGSIMAAFMAEKVSGQKKSKTTYHLVKTIVTTDLQENIAKKNKLEFHNVLTGFKYIAEVMGQLDKKKDHKFLFGGEESYGYLPISFVRDKDSISSALLLLEILAEKKDLVEYLNQIFLQYGLFQESLKSLTLKGSEGKAQIAAAIDAIRNKDLLGEKIGERTIEGILDFQTATAKGTASSKIFSGMPKSNVIQILLSGNAKVTVRPSGTEPKLKLYSSFQSLTPPQKEKDIPELQKILEVEIKSAETALLKFLGLHG